jgi:hypothetical protein
MVCGVNWDIDWGVDIVCGFEVWIWGVDMVCGVYRLGHRLVCKLGCRLVCGFSVWIWIMDMGCGYGVWCV